MLQAKLHIHLANLKHNYLYAKNLANDKVFAVIKTNAYGFGVERIANYLDDFVDGFAVASFDEALHLKSSTNTQKPILIMMGCFKQSQLLVALQHNFIPAITTIEQAQYLLDLQTNGKINTPIKIFLKYDSGMSRLGLNEDDFIYYYQQFKQNKHIDITIMSHFCCGEDIGKSQQHIEKLKNITHKLNITNTSFNNSNGILNNLIIDNISRMGISLYGINHTISQHNLKTVVSLYAPIIAIKDIKQGDCVGYGQTFCCTKDTQIAIIKIGYGDGYPRNITKNTPVYINNTQTIILGRVSMDMTIIDVSNISVKVGDNVELFGKHIDIALIEKSSGIIAYEIFCGMANRVQRVCK